MTKKTKGSYYAWILGGDPDYRAWGETPQEAVKELAAQDEISGQVVVYNKNSGQTKIVKVKVTVEFE